MIGSAVGLLYLVASTGETGISLSQDTFHSEKEGPLHLILCKEVETVKLFMLCRKFMTHLAELQGCMRDYLAQNGNGKVGGL